MYALAKPRCTMSFAWPRAVFILYGGMRLSSPQRQQQLDVTRRVAASHTRVTRLIYILVAVLCVFGVLQMSFFRDMDPIVDSSDRRFLRTRIDHARFLHGLTFHFFILY